MNPLVRDDLSLEAKQTFQVVALLATMLVVGIHYKTDVPNFPSPAAATPNELAQEFLFGGIGRVAVPLFAFAAGFFYFRSDDGSFKTYRKKLGQRARTVLLPYFVIGSIATAAWLLNRRIEGNPPSLTPGMFLSTWLLRPPAEQLWFLRDLMVLVTIAPLIRMAGSRGLTRFVLIAVLAMAWMCNWQCFPIVAGWRLLHMETLLFFTLGFAAVSHLDWIETVGRSSAHVFAAVVALWCGLVAARICVRADFDLWYATDYQWADLLLHQASVLVGCIALFMTAWRIRCESLIRLSGAAFFVYLVHEFPLRAVVERFAASYLHHDTSCWIITPIVLTGCFAAAMLLSRFFPSLMAILTGGRTPLSAACMTRSCPTSRTPAQAL